eukprot:comp7944_c0_seq1/m.8295 comp7944_c0_seq1/g.8295  ORF comp7944_c0_seq1/g.8295 comp7944_c0_seq1/m.8295 type:complete len:428 (-) comp7944_c0_seq1:27-1310(-)
MIDVRERIKINGTSIDESTFARIFWSIWQPLEQTGEDMEAIGFFRFVTLMGFRAFVESKIDVAVVEVGIGGRLDCTNVVQHPVVCAISRLDMDHVALLGNTIEKIAFEKAGIIKANSPIITIPGQPGGSFQVIENVAAEKHAPLTVARGLDAWSWPGGKAPVLSLQGGFQRENAALAVEVVNTFMTRTSGAPADLGHIVRGLETSVWPGRAQHYRVNALLDLYLDGAHTPKSMEACAEWFATSVSSSSLSSPALTAPSDSAEMRILMFHCTTDRNPYELLQSLLQTMQAAGNVHAASLDTLFDYALFVAPMNAEEGQLASKEDWGTREIIIKWHNRLATDYLSLLPPSSSPSSSSLSSSEASSHDFPTDTSANPAARIRVFTTVEAAMDFVSQFRSRQRKVLITGSLKLVGAFLADMQNTEITAKWS